MKESQARQHDLELVACLNQLAISCKFVGEMAEAGRLYRRALRIQERLAPGDLNALASLCHNIGGLEHARGHFEKGEPWARRSIALRERAFGRAHLAVAADLAAHAALLQELERHDEALSAYRRAAGIFRKMLGPKHYELAVVYANQAGLLRAQGLLRAAEKLYRRAIAIEEVVLPEKHLDRAITLNNLGALLITTGRPSEAVALLQRALRIFGAVVGSRHFQARVCHANLRRALKAS